MATTRSSRPVVNVGKISVSIIKGNLNEESADVIVSSSNSKLHLKDGRASAALLAAAGDNIQTECDENYPNGIQPGEVAITGPGNLHCCKIYHACLPKYKGSTEIKILYQLMLNCLEDITKMKMTSVAFPSFGTGFLGYPSAEVAETMFRCIEDFGKKNAKPTLQSVTIVIFHKDKSFGDFRKEARKRARSSEVPKPSLSTQPVQECSQSYGHVTLKLITGELAQQQVDVIVNSANKSMKLSSGGLSQSLIDIAGEELQEEANQKYKNGIVDGDVAVTGGYGLKCREVYHGSIPSWHGKTGAVGPDQILITFVTECLLKASHYKSIAFPALGTGFLKHPPDLVALNMVECVKMFQQKNPKTSLTDIRIIVMKDQQDFKAAMRSSSLQVARPASPLQECRRGTKGYYQAQYKKEPCPPPYWTHFNDGKKIKDWNTQSSIKKSVILPVDQKTYNAIAKLFKDAWTGGSAPKIKQIQRVENLPLFERYSYERQRVFRKVADRKDLKFKSPESIPGGGKPILTSSKIDPHLSKDLYAEINEHYLFHGTKHHCVSAITGQGMDFRLAAIGNFGTGVYGAEDSIKSHSYTGE
ncbi:hypothetical protein ScPMuIL_011438 [Solemya velum]